MHNTMKPLRFYLLPNTADERLQQPLSVEAFELTGFLRGLNEQALTATLGRNLK